MRALHGVGLVRRIEPAGSAALFETRVEDNHHHLVCRDCGSTVDVDCIVGGAPCLTPSETAGFEVDEAEVIFWGRCPDCLSRSRHEPARRRFGKRRGEHGRHEHPPGDGRKRQRQRALADAQDEQRLVAECARPQAAPASEPARRSAGRGLRLRRRVRDPRPRRAEAGRRRGADDLAGVVAGRLGPLRAADHPHGLAQRRHVPHQRRARRRRRRHAALRAAQQLAGQRQPRQGAPAALARQAEARARRSPGPTCSSSRATAPSSRWASRPSASPEGARTCGSPTTSTGAQRRSGSPTSATAATASSRTRSRPCRWD